MTICHITLHLTFRKPASWIAAADTDGDMYLFLSFAELDHSRFDYSHFQRYIQGSSPFLRRTMPCGYLLPTDHEVYGLSNENRQIYNSRKTKGLVSDVTV